MLDLRKGDAISRPWSTGRNRKDCSLVAVARRLYRKEVAKAMHEFRGISIIAIFKPPCLHRSNRRARQNGSARSERGFTTPSISRFGMGSKYEGRRSRKIISRHAWNRALIALRLRLISATAVRFVDRSAGGRTSIPNQFSKIWCRTSVKRASADRLSSLPITPTVVNTDADQVILATSIRAMPAGSLTSRITVARWRTPPCVVRCATSWRGGRHAFLERERRYRLQWQHILGEAEQPGAR